MKDIVPSTDPWVTPHITSSHEPVAWLILVLCFLFDESWKPYSDRYLIFLYLAQACGRSNCCYVVTLVEETDL